MNPDEYMDRLLERRERGEQQLPVSTDEVAARLAAAEVLTQLREITVPPEFAGYLELHIRARARNFGQQTSTALPVVRSVSRAGAHCFLASRSWTAVLGFAAVLLAVCMSLLTASARSLPGDTLYGLKQAEDQLTLNFASGPQDRASAQIDQLRNALVDLRTVVTAGRADDAIRLALSSVAATTHDSRGAVASLPLHARGRRTAWIFVCVIPAQGYQQGWNSAFLIHFLPPKKSVREPVLGSPSPTGLSRSIRAPSRSKTALTKEPSS